MTRREFKKGDRVTAEVVWPNGRTTNSEGEFLFEQRGKAYVMLEVGVVEVDLDTVELVPS